MTILRPRAEKNSKTFFFQKKRNVPQNIHLGTETPFRLSSQKTTKKHKFRWKSEQNNSLDFFRESMCFHKRSLRKRGVEFWQLCWFFLPNFDFFVKILKKTALNFGEKLPNSLVFQEKIVTLRSCSRQIKKAIWQSSGVFCKSPKKNPPEVWKKFQDIRSSKKNFLDKAIWKRGMQFWQPCWYFSAKRPIFLQITREKFPLNFETSYRPAYVFTENEILPKSSSRLRKRTFD